MDRWVDGMGSDLSTFVQKWINPNKSASLQNNQYDKKREKADKMQRKDSFEKAVQFKSLPLHFVVIKLQAFALCRCNFSNNKAYNRVSLGPSNI